MAISILDMGNTKKRNVRETVISILSKQYPLTIKKIYSLVKKEYKLDVTYQAVFKLVKEMLNDNILQNGETEMEYQLNIGWIKQLEDEIAIIKEKYLIEEKNTDDRLKKWISRFISAVGPQVKEYIGTDNACIVGVDSGGKWGGKLYAIALWKYLFREGLTPSYVDYELIAEVSGKEIGIQKKDVANKKVIIVDSGTFSGRTYKNVMNKINRFKKELKIKEIKYVCDKDEAGLADFCRINN